MRTVGDTGPTDWKHFAYVGEDIILPLKLVGNGMRTTIGLCQARNFVCALFYHVILNVAHRDSTRLCLVLLGAPKVRQVQNDTLRCRWAQSKSECNEDQMTQMAFGI